MESTQNLKKRIRSVANINKITKAMELVAATKMRKAQEIALTSRPYAFTALDLLASLTLLEQSASWRMPDLLKKRKVTKTLYVLVASDKGLAGAFNSSLFRKFEQFLRGQTLQGLTSQDSFVAVGEKSFQYLSKKIRTIDSSVVLKKFVQVGDYTTPEQVEPITNYIVEGYLKKEWDKVITISMNFKSALKQEPHIRKILPVEFDQIKETVREIIPTTGKFAELIKENNMDFIANNSKIKEYLIEPSPEIVLEDLAKHLFFMQVYHLILEANASEHSARRMAMKTASDNASELGENLNLQYNKSRQATITKEIIEITAGAEALS